MVNPPSREHQIAKLCSDLITHQATAAGPVGGINRDQLDAALAALREGDVDSEALTSLFAKLGLDKPAPAGVPPQGTSRTPGVFGVVHGAPVYVCPSGICDRVEGTDNGLAPRCLVNDAQLRVTELPTTTER